jgi:hypothetical protein
MRIAIDVAGRDLLCRDKDMYKANKLPHKQVATLLAGPKECTMHRNNKTSKAHAWPIEAEDLAMLYSVS